MSARQPMKEEHIMPKIKTNRAAAKRFKKTGTGKLKRNKAYKSHIWRSIRFIWRFPARSAPCAMNSMRCSIKGSITIGKPLLP